jgi:hypothetical protein
MQTKLNPRTEEMRVQISKVYPYPKWTLRVKKMHDNQVVSIWHRMVRDGQIKF